MENKRCEGCGREKPMAYFKKFTTTRKVRYSAKCLNCKAEHDRRKRMERKKALADMMPFSYNPY